MFNPVYTPFSISEAANILEIKIGKCIDLRKNGELKASLEHDMRPDLSVSHHSAVDLVEFTARSSIAQLKKNDQPIVLEIIEASMDFLCDDEWIQSWNRIDPTSFEHHYLNSLSEYLKDTCSNYELVQISLEKRALPKVEALVMGHWFNIVHRCVGLLQ